MEVCKTLIRFVFVQIIHGTYVIRHRRQTSLCTCFMKNFHLSVFFRYAYYYFVTAEPSNFIMKIIGSPKKYCTTRWRKQHTLTIHLLLI